MNDIKLENHLINFFTGHRVLTIIKNNNSSGLYEKNFKIEVLDYSKTSINDYADFRKKYIRLHLNSQLS
ncbi:hypothetical protein [Cetobacterium sp.]|uniref:hypothetical protein n=1 Tax=Cetobacterium sp. TaxID=2071632 RepID=UPI003F66B42F